LVDNPPRNVVAQPVSVSLNTEDPGHVHRTLP
jgi:hypothetical protein